MSSDQAQPIASTSTASIPGTGDEKQIAIRLSTKDPLYTIPPAKFLVPASWRRFHLSELINKVLDNGQSPFLDLSSRDSGTTGGSLPSPRLCAAARCESGRSEQLLAAHCVSSSSRPRADLERVPLSVERGASALKELAALPPRTGTR